MKWNSRKRTTRNSPKNNQIAKLSCGLKECETDGKTKTRKPSAYWSGVP